MASPRLTHVLTVAGLILIGMIGFSVVGKKFLDRPPFLIVLEPTGKTTIVQFIQPLDFDSKMTVSPKFKINRSISEPFQSALTSRHATIPGGVVEHGDTTMLPGAFRIRFGDAVFVVMSHRIEVNGKDYHWLERPITSETNIDRPPQPAAN